MHNGIKIEQCYYDGTAGTITRRNRHYIPMSVKLRDFLAKKFVKFAQRNKTKNRFALSFTYGIDFENFIECVSVCHPSDQFCRKIGRKIVINRIEELRNNFENFDWKKYPWIDKLER